MRLPSLLVATAVALALAPSTGRSESSLRCAGGIVQVGDSKLDLLAKCGQPTLQDRRQDESWPPRVVEVVEEWSYDFGPNQFTMSVTVQRGQVVAITRGSYGYTGTPGKRPFVPRRATCDSSAVKVGDRKLDLLAKCGEPAARDAWQEDRAVSRVDADGGRAWSGGTVQVERWVFDFGPQSFVAEALLENGEVVTVQRGGYGHAG